MIYETALKRPALYNPSLWSRDEVRTYYVARQGLLVRLLDDIRREKPGTRPQHRLILGMRGMGKSTLLRRLAIGVEDDGEMTAQWLPLLFPEEQYNVATLADFWLNCLDALGDLFEGRGDAVMAKTIDAEVERINRTDNDSALQALLRIAKKLDRRLLLLVDNIDLILERIKDKDWVLREALQEHPELMLIGASSRALEATYDYGASFYDFFRIDELRGLSEDEMRETVVTLARLRGADEVVRRLESDPGRLRVLHALTGGNPRTAVLLYGVLLKGVDGDVRSDLEALLDEVTPLYKARFDELPTQAQQLLDKLALHWDPMTARQLADALCWSVNLVSAQLERLAVAGVVEKVKAGSGKRMAFQVGERFFNIWYLMRASRRVRRKLMWLVEFMRALFSSDELQNLARTSLKGTVSNQHDAEYRLALSRALGTMPVARALETQALASLLSGRSCGRLEDVLDLHGEDRDLLSKAERMKARREAEDILKPLINTKKEQELLHKFMNLPVSASKLLELARQFQGMPRLNAKFLRQITEKPQKEVCQWYGKSACEKLSVAIAAGEMESHADIEGGEAAAVRYDASILELIPKLFNCRVDAKRAVELEQLSRRAIAEDKTGAAYWYCLAQALKMQGRPDEALTVCQKAAGLAPFAKFVTRLMAKICLDLPEKKDIAEAAYRKLLELEPNDTRAMFDLMMLIGEEEGGVAEALGLARKLCEIEPNDAWNWIALSTLLFRNKEGAEEQIAAIYRARELEPDNLDVPLILVGALFAHSRINEALAATRDWLPRFIDAEETTGKEVQDLVTLMDYACMHDAAPALLAVMDETDAAERFRPAREALAAVVAGTVEVLNGVAPEVRQPALEVLALIKPEMLYESP